MHEPFRSARRQIEFGPVATGSLGGVQRAISRFDEFGKARRSFATAKARRTEAGGHPDDRIAERKRLRRQLGACAYDDRRQIRFVGMRDDVKNSSPPIRPEMSEERVLPFRISPF